MRARTSIWLALLAAGVLSTGSALAVSDGNYDPAEMGCSGEAEQYDQNRVEKGCHAIMFKVSDKSHTYFSVGSPQMAEDTNPHDRALVVCIDVGTGKKHCAYVDRKGFHVMTPKKGTPVDPGELHVFMGADDNLFFGEHDGSRYVNNGPSDGGAIIANVRPMSAGTWLAHVLGDNGKKWLLTHPLPVVDGGMGACADGVCFSVETQRRTAYQGGDTSGKHRDVSNYHGKKWDPPTCSGPSDEAEDCGGHNMGWWHDREGTTYVQPGIQIYEDPDAQGSPLEPYPLPAIYVGTCGLVVGGGAVKAPPSPFTNSAGQLRIATGCG